MKPEFSRILDVDKLLLHTRPTTLTSSASENTAIAKRLGLVSLESLVAEMSVVPPAALQKQPRLDIVVTADLIQVCVVSMRPLSQKVTESFSLFLNSGPEPEFLTSEEAYLDFASEEAETLYLDGGDTFDMGEIVVQYLSLALNPYPRDPDAMFDAKVHGSDPKNPFESLKNLSTNNPSKKDS